MYVCMYVLMYRISSNSSRPPNRPRITQTVKLIDRANYSRKYDLFALTLPPEVATYVALRKQALSNSIRGMFVAYGREQQSCIPAMCVCSTYSLSIKCYYEIKNINIFHKIPLVIRTQSIHHIICGLSVCEFRDGQKINHLGPLFCYD